MDPSGGERLRLPVLSPTPQLVGRASCPAASRGPARLPQGPGRPPRPAGGATAERGARDQPSDARRRGLASREVSCVVGGPNGAPLPICLTPGPASSGNSITWRNWHFKISQLKRSVCFSNTRHCELLQLTLVFWFPLCSRGRPPDCIWIWHLTLFPFAAACSSPFLSLLLAGCSGTTVRSWPVKIRRQS